jgi:hypothetical protein
MLPEDKAPLCTFLVQVCHLTQWFRHVILQMLSCNWLQVTVTSRHTSVNPGIAQ